MISERDYPYDAALRVEDFEGLNKLRCVSDREVAATLYRLWFNLAPDTPKSEEFDPSEYDPSDLREPSGFAADASDRADAAIHHAWAIFYRNMAAYEAQHGRKLSRRQREQHEWNFAGNMKREYGRTHPLASWLAKRSAWEERTVGRGNGGGKAGGWQE
jgi:hypothetical protein